MYDTNPYPYGFPPPAPPKKPWYQRPLIAIPTGIFAFLLLIGVIGAATGAGEQGNKNNAAGPQTAAPVTVERTVTAPAVTSSAAPRPARVTSPAAKESSVPVQADDDSWVMTNEVGHTLQNAQDNIQALTDDGIFFTDSTDATGADRMQILDSNWKVCSQNVAPGSRITADTDIVFDAVKLSETCP